MRKLGLLALTAGLTLGVAAPSQASVTLDPGTVPLVSTTGGANVSAPVTLSISADETSRDLTGISILPVSGVFHPYTFTENCPATFPGGAQTCTIQVTLTPNSPALWAAGPYPAQLKALVDGTGGPKTATALLSGLIGPALPGGSGTPGTPGETKPGDGTSPGAGDKGKGKAKGCKKGKGKGKAKGKASSSAKKGKAKCGKKKGKGKAKGK